MDPGAQSFVELPEPLNDHRGAFGDDFDSEIHGAGSHREVA